MEKKTILKLSALFFIFFLLGLCSSVDCRGARSMDEIQSIELKNCGRKEGCKDSSTSTNNGVEPRDWRCTSDLDCPPYWQCPNHPQCIDGLCVCN
ncbi:hypothetical protein LINGRAHAP2_LOCUS15153 [Linum grandiflorum]